MYSKARIDKLFEEGREALTAARLILDAVKSGEVIAAPDQVKADELMDLADTKAAEARRLLRVNEAETALTSPTPDTEKMSEVPDGVKIVIGGKELSPAEIKRWQQNLAFRAYAPIEPALYAQYKNAMAAYLYSKHDTELTSDERKALSAGSGAAGGYLVQDTFWNGMIVASRSRSAMRRICNVLPPLPSGAMIIPTEDSIFSDAAWTQEIGTGSADTVEPFGQRRLQMFPLAKRVLVSNTFMRTPTFDVEAYVRDRMGYKFGIPEEYAFINGSGANQPYGLLTTINGHALPTYSTAVATVVDADDLINWVYTLGETYANAPRTTILCNRAFVRKVRTLKQGTGDYIWAPGLSGEQPATILGVPYAASDQYDDALSALDAWETNGIAAVIGDFEYAWIGDALEMTIQRLVELYAQTNQTGYIGRKESGFLRVLDEAFLGLKIS